METYNTIRYKFFHLIKDVTTSNEEKIVRKKDILYKDTTITRRHVLGLFSYILSISMTSYTETKTK